ncbi:MAG: replication-associated recombination protein A [Deltaproteobacteria bacterium]|nr:replication-associated recombination protein A [Deltaproteobacteria bacterium]
MVKETISPETPLAERIRPDNIDLIVGQEHLLGPKCALRRALDAGRIFSVIFWGPPGTGKTTLARLIAKYTNKPFRAFSAVTSGVKELREILGEAGEERAKTGESTILFVDEIHRFNKAQQDAFLPHIESGLIILVGATTQNPSFEVIPPLLSRARVMVLKPLDDEGLKKIINRALTDKEKGMGNLELTLHPKALNHIIDISGGDARSALNNLEIAALYTVEEKGANNEITVELVESALDRKSLPYDKDGEEHYNIISAFHKSLRGSDVQASVYWLYRMIVAGEDPLYIARRMIRFASEDVGIADPLALQVALNAFEAWEKVGPPEAELALIEAAVYLATAPKSNALYVAQMAVKKEIQRSGALAVPMHIRNAPTKLMKELGYSRGYLYPHNYPDAKVDQEYLPEQIKNSVFYHPTDRGKEREINKRMGLFTGNKGATKRPEE